MKTTRRSVMGALAGAAILGRRASAAQPAGIEIAPGPFRGARESLKAFEVPAWFRDAKFGIWAHWGPQSAPEFGDWYARRVYEEGGPTYKYHLEHYGHPSKFGYKDIVHTWKGDRFDADYLMQLYRRAGARYFVSMGVHHDNFDMWDSKHQPRWNAAAAGIKKDVVGLFKKAADKQGLRFGVSEHLARSYNWFAVAHTADKAGPYAGVPYDGADPKFADLYHDYSHGAPADRPPGIGAWDTGPEWWQRQWFLRIKDLVDKYQPDLLYSDGRLPFEQYGLSVVANLYNLSARRHGGKVEAIYTSKLAADCETGTCVLDLERGIVDKVWPNPWQTDTCVGDWHYLRGVKYKTPKMVIDMLVDIVSRNGNLLLNFPLPNSGMLDAEEHKILEGITGWMAVNGEGIYGTRPWRVFGYGPATEANAQIKERFNERNRKDLGPEDVRFTTKGKTLYAFLMGWPAKECLLAPLGTGTGAAPKVHNVELVGFKGRLEWSQEQGGLHVQMPAERPCDYAVALRMLLG
jgi:alpha-L-fucosidase